MFAGAKRCCPVAAGLVAGWVLVVQPYDVERDCTFRYRDIPATEWSNSNLGPYGASAECERVRTELARRLQRRPQRFSRWDWVAPFKWLWSEPSTWEECQAKADYWDTPHTRCVER